VYNTTDEMEYTSTNIKGFQINANSRVVTTVAETYAHKCNQLASAILTIRDLNCITSPTTTGLAEQVNKITNTG